VGGPLAAPCPAGGAVRSEEIRDTRRCLTARRGTRGFAARAARQVTLKRWMTGRNGWRKTRPCSGR
jgi:hypothetical protein